MRLQLALGQSARETVQPGRPQVMEFGQPGFKLQEGFGVQPVVPPLRVGA